MTASALLLALGIVALLGAANALRPARGALLVGPSWLAAWITVELAPHLGALATVAGVVLAVLGGLEQTIGWIGVGALAVADAVAVPMILRARRTSWTSSPSPASSTRRRPRPPTRALTSPSRRS